MFVASFIILPAYAQQAGAPRPAAGGGAAAPQQPARPAGNPSASGAMTGDFKIAIINTQFFAVDKTGITRLVNAIGTVDREFQPRRQELQNLQTQMTTLQQDIQKQAPLAAPKDLAQKQGQFDTMKLDFERKQQDAERDYQKRMGEMLAPLYEDIGKNLEAFARTRGIGAVIDISKLAQAVYLTNDQMDITTAFIADYNSKNPATASAATPGK
ncbi:MAG: OmpH family outer membrane protein [Pyrinomonadaceae bacterium]